MSSGSGSTTGPVEVEVILEAQEQDSSEEPPMDEWSSLNIVYGNPKIIASERGLFSPGSGEICTKYIAMSASEVFRHPYYNFPALIDPGIMEALEQPEHRKMYHPDGQELYLALCKEMNTIPVKMFHRGLLQDNINLKYYSVRPSGVRAMAKALENNENVGKFNLTDNFLNDDACLHLGEMLKVNKTLVELNLSGCRIGPSGLHKLLCYMSNNKTLKILNLNKNKLGDEGIAILATSFIYGCKLDEVYLSYNGITGKGAETFADSLETYNNFRILDLSWNSMQGPKINKFFSRLSENVVLQELDLSWNSLSEQRTADFITKCIINCTALRKLNLTYNKFSGTAISTIANGLKKSKLTTLNLSFNPLTPKDAFTILDVMRLKQVKLQNLVLDNVSVNENFLELLTQIQSLKFRKNSVVTYGDVRRAFTSKGTDMRELILNRLAVVCKQKKSAKVDFALVALQLHKDKVSNIDSKSFSQILKTLGLVLDEALLDQLMSVFPGPSTPKEKTLNIPLLVDYVKRKWPDKQLPPTPPPEPEPQIQQKNKKKKK